MDTHVPEDATSFRDNLTVCIRYRVYGCSTRSVAELKIHSALANDRNYRIDNFFNNCCAAAKHLLQPLMFRPIFFKKPIAVHTSSAHLKPHYSYGAGHRLSFSRPLESCFVLEIASPATVVFFHVPTVSALILVAAKATF